MHWRIENEDVREKMGKNGRKRVEEEKYTWERVAEMVERTYLSLME